MHSNEKYSENVIIKLRFNLFSSCCPWFFLLMFILPFFSWFFKKIIASESISRLIHKHQVICNLKVRLRNTKQKQNAINILVFYCCVIDYQKGSSWKQYPFVSSRFWRSEVQHGVAVLCSGTHRTGLMVLAGFGVLWKL